MIKEEDLINEEQKNLLWAVIPEEVRSEIAEAYGHRFTSSEYTEGWRGALKELFGEDNLIYNVEPKEEILTVKKTKVQKNMSSLRKRLEEVKQTPLPPHQGLGRDTIVSERGFLNGAIAQLTVLFGENANTNQTVRKKLKDRHSKSEIG